MSEAIFLERVFRCEMPFTLNLPTGLYPVLVGSSMYEFDLRQGWFSAEESQGAKLAGSADGLRTHFGDRWASISKRPLRTIVSHRDQNSLAIASLPIASEEQLFAAAQQVLLRQPGRVPEGPEALVRQAKEWRDSLDEEGRKSFEMRARVGLAAKAAFNSTDNDIFCDALNALIRLYMVWFEDRFVQEICESMLCDTEFGGIQCVITYDGQFLEQFRYAGGLFPYIIKQPWLEHSAEKTDGFRARLQSNPITDPVELLAIRAKSLLLRSAYRSAIIESSAALDLALSRKIRDGLRQKGQSVAAIDVMLRQQANQRFDDRAKRILREATGQSAAELDPPLWQRVGQHRSTYRQGIAHADTEPSKTTSTQVVDDFLQLARLIDGIPI